MVELRYLNSFTITTSTVQGVPRLSPYNSWKQLQPYKPELDKHKKEGVRLL